MELDTQQKHYLRKYKSLNKSQYHCQATKTITGTGTKCTFYFIAVPINGELTIIKSPLTKQNLACLKQTLKKALPIIVTWDFHISWGDNIKLPLSVFRLCVSLGRMRWFKNWKCRTFKSILFKVNFAEMMELKITITSTGACTLSWKQTYSN